MFRIIHPYLHPPLNNLPQQPPPHIVQMLTKAGSVTAKALTGYCHTLSLRV